MCVRVWSPRDNHRSFQNDFLCVKKVSYHILRWWKKVSHMVSHRESFLHPFQNSRIDFHRFFRYKLLIRCKWLTIWLTTCMPKGGEKFFFVKHTNDSPFDSLFDPPQHGCAIFAKHSHGPSVHGVLMTHLLTHRTYNCQNRIFWGKSRLRLIDDFFWKCISFDIQAQNQNSD